MIDPPLVCCNVPQPSASLLVAGVQRLIRVPGPPVGDMCPDLDKFTEVRPWYGATVNAGQRIGIMATGPVPYAHPWNEFMPEPSDADLAEGDHPGFKSAFKVDTILPLERIVGSVRVEHVAYLTNLDRPFDDDPHMGIDPFLLSDEMDLCFSQVAPSITIDFEDQRPFVQNCAAGTWFLVVTDPHKTNERCPVCDGKGGVGWVGDHGGGGPWSPCPWCWPREATGDAVLGVKYADYERFVGTCPPIDPTEPVTNPARPYDMIPAAVIDPDRLWSMPEWRD